MRHTSRDGNLVIPMSLDEKLEFYKMLLKVGFKEIEIGFPAASETEYEFPAPPRRGRPDPGRCDDPS